MKKKIWRAVTALALWAAVPLTAGAEVFYSGDGWSVYFDGDKMTSTFKSSDIDDVIYRMEPGDTADIHLDLENKYSAVTSWYMTNEILQSLEDSQKVAEGGAYSYVLTYYNPEGQARVLYDSDEVGGEQITEAGEGLHQATDALADYFYLDDLNSGESGEITLKVHLEGETQGNAYQDTLAQLQMNFAVELGNAHAGGSTRRVVQMPRTGDPGQLARYVIVAVAAVGFMIPGISNIRRKEES